MRVPDSTHKNLTMNSPLLAPVEPPVKLAYKWKQGTSKPSEASIEEIEQFIYWRIDKYKEFGWKNEDLSEAYASDFQHFTKDEFDKCSDDPIRKLRDVLRAQGVYIRKGRGINIARELTAVIQDDIPWPEDDPERPISTRTPLAHSTAPAAPTTLATLTQNPTSGTQLHNNSRELTTLAKLYTSDEHKYKGDLLDSFDYKYTIFIDNCQKAAIPPEILPQAFSTMLSGPPLEYYYTNCRNQNMTITDLYNKYLDQQRNNNGLTFVKLDLQTLRVIAFTDSSFANNRDHSSQIGYVIVLADADNNANIVHWQSIKCRRVTRSVLASELYALSLGFDTAATIKSTLNQILACPRQGSIPLTICIDSKSLYECLVKLGTTQEKRLMVDLMCLRQSYERREISEILWIQGDKNPADAMTKEKPCNALRKLMDTNKLELDIDGWVEREGEGYN